MEFLKVEHFKRNTANAKWTKTSTVYERHIDGYYNDGLEGHLQFCKNIGASVRHYQGTESKAVNISPDKLEKEEYTLVANRNSVPANYKDCVAGESKTKQ